MVNGTAKTIETRSNLEDKQSPESHKIWNLQRKKDLININSNGSLPLGLSNKIRENEIHPTNYITSDNKVRTLIKVGGQIYVSDMQRLTGDGSDIQSDSIVVNNYVMNNNTVTYTTSATAILAGDYSDFTITDTNILATSKIFCSISNGTNTLGLPTCLTLTITLGQVIVRVLNVGGQSLSADTNGTLILNLLII